MKHFSVKLPLATLFLLVFILAGCENKTSKSNAAGNNASVEEIPSYIKNINKSIMALHTETMTKMDRLILVRSLLNKKLAIVESGPAKDSIRLSITMIQNANNAMMDWMHDFHEPNMKTNKDDAIKYMNEQLGKILNVKIQIRNSLDHANAILHSISNKD